LSGGARARTFPPWITTQLQLHMSFPNDELKIIAKLSHDGHVVLDALSENGMPSTLVNLVVTPVCIHHFTCSNAQWL